ncbi:MAG: short chain dehydrogenase [Candidatus Rokuibacteriota bacterium]|nr:MAG: short chain dehydrogenase [Candidatus Rokubacteria bacterium]
MDGRVAIVTGASAGIGRATALSFAQHGAHVVVADVDDQRGEAVAEEAAASGPESLFVHADVTSPADVANLVSRSLARFERLDYAHNNAGIQTPSAYTADCSLDDWNRTVAVNLTGTFLCMREEIPRLLESGGGAIVNTSSAGGLKGFPGAPAYVAAKHGVIGLTKSAALEYATNGIRVNAVCPGVVDTELVTGFTQDDASVTQQLLDVEPVRRFGTPTEIADAVVWLCSDRASFVTGHALVVDGGQLAG